MYGASNASGVCIQHDFSFVSNSFSKFGSRVLLQCSRHQLTISALNPFINNAAAMLNMCTLWVSYVQVAHLVVIETDQMYYNRKMAEYEAAKLRPPIIIRHDLPAGFAAGPALQETAASSQQQRSIQQRQRTAEPS
jgi:hypothetical protein